LAEQLQATVLMGGGVDSTCLVAWLLDQGTRVSGVHFDYGHPSASRELDACRSIADHYRVPLEALTVRPAIYSGAEEVPFRNALLALHAAARIRSGLLAIGIHAGTGYFDCGPDFAESLQAMVLGHTRGKVRLVAPWVRAAKSDILVEARRLRVPLDLTYSCQAGTPVACGKCRSCRERRDLGC